MEACLSISLLLKGKHDYHGEHSCEDGSIDVSKLPSTRHGGPKEQIFIYTHNIWNKPKGITYEGKATRCLLL